MLLFRGKIACFCRLLVDKEPQSERGGVGKMGLGRSLGLKAFRKSSPRQAGVSGAEDEKGPTRLPTGNGHALFSR